MIVNQGSKLTEEEFLQAIHLETELENQIVTNYNRSYLKEIGEYTIKIEVKNLITEETVSKSVQLIVESSDEPMNGALSLRYVSSFSFGKIAFSKNSQDVQSEEIIDQKGQVMSHMITIQDAREQDKRNGWELTVKQESSLIDGSELILNPYISDANTKKYGANVVSSEMALNEEAQVLAFVKGNGSTYQPGPFSIGLSGSGNDGVTLRVPGGVGIGKYQTTINWILTEGP